MPDYDSPWKEALDLYLRAFLQLFFTEIEADIDWAKGYEALDRELQQIAPQSAHGRRTVDRLFRVWRRNGREAWVLIHIEVQVGRVKGFTKRMKIYHSRLADQYNRLVVSIAVLADDDPSWRPSRHVESLWGCRSQLDFPTVKLLDYANRVEELERSDNPFAHVVLAHLKALETRKDPENRREWKFRLIRGLFERGFRREDIERLFRVVDWLMELPPPEENHFWAEMEAFQEEQRMSYVSTPERVGIRRGILRAIEETLGARFGSEATELTSLLAEVYEADQLLAVLRVIVKAADLDEVRRTIAEAAAPPPKKKASTRKRKSS